MSTYNKLWGTFNDTQVVDSDGYSSPVPGGVVNVRTGTVVYTQDAVTAYLFTLPQGAEIVWWQINVVTAFDGSGSDLLDIGDGTTANRFANDISLATAGQIVTGFDDDEYNVELPIETKIFATYTDENSDATAGEAQISVGFIIR